MPYTYTPAANPLSIAERQFSADSEIRFTVFTSCIGVVSVNEKTRKVIGIHLPLRDNQNAIAVGDLGPVINILQTKGYKKVNTIILGEIDVWRRSALVVYNDLVRKLGNPREFNWISGVYGASFSEDRDERIGHIELTMAGVPV